jgi:hypothetical protein
MFWRTNLLLRGLFLAESTFGTISLFAVRAANYKATWHQNRVLLAMDALSNSVELPSLPHSTPPDIKHN